MIDKCFCCTKERDGKFIPKSVKGKETQFVCDNCFHIKEDKDDSDSISSAVDSSVPVSGI
jgi:hypothetical protein